MEYFSYGQSSIRETLDIVERGFERLGIPLHGVMRLPKVEPQTREDLRQFADVTPAMVDEMIRLTGMRYSQAEIARTLGCSQSAVSKNLRKHGYRGVQGRRINRNRVSAGEVQAA